MTEEGKGIEGEFVKSIVVKDLGDVVTEYAEVGFDLALKEGVIRDIPILNSIISIAKVGFNIRDRLYLKKIIAFLAQIGQTTQEQRNEFVNKYCDDVKRFEETISLILEQADRIEKTNLIGKIFRACVLGAISYKDALLLSDMVNKAFWRDLEYLLNKPKRGQEDKDAERRLFLVGFARMSEGEKLIGSYDEFDYLPNKYVAVLRMIHQEKFTMIDSYFEQHRSIVWNEIE